MLLLALASLICQVEPVARWTFDGDVQVSGPSKMSANAGGRLEFIDSPVSGKAAVFNGVDAFVEITPPKRLSNGNGDFSLSAWVFPLDRRPAPLFSRWGWTIRQIDAGALRWEIDDRPASTSTGVYGFGQWNHVVISLRLLEQKHEVNIYVNGTGFPAGTLTSMNQDPFGAPLLIKFWGYLPMVELGIGADNESALSQDQNRIWVRSKSTSPAPLTSGQVTVRLALGSLCGRLIVATFASPAAVPRVALTRFAARRTGHFPLRGTRHSGPQAAKAVRALPAAAPNPRRSHHPTG